MHEEDATVINSDFWSSIKQLNLIKPVHDAKFMLQCLLKCTSLEKLSLGSVRSGPEAFSKAYLQVLSQAFDHPNFCSHINAFFISRDLNSSREAIVALTKHCRNLVKIYFSARDIDDAIMKQFFLLCRSTLESLDVDLFDTAVNIGVCVAEYRGMSAYLEYCPNLKSFDIFSLKSEVIAVGQYCPDLSEVALMHLFSIDIDDQGLIVLFEGCRKIQKLEIHLPSFTNAVMLKAIECCRDLKHITLSSCIISAESMESLVANCPLVEDDVFDATENFLRLFTHWGFPNLVIFRYTGSSFCDVSLMGLVQKSPRLKDLMLDNGESQLITNVGMYHIASHCRNLEALSLYHIPSVKEPGGLIEILLKNPRLSEFIFSLDNAPLIVVENYSTYTAKLQAILDSRV